MVAEDVRGTPRSPEEAFDRYARWVGAVALRLTGRPDDVDDIVQETFVQLVRRWDTIDDLARLKGWLGTVTTRVVAARLKRHRFRSLFWVEGEPDYERVAGAGASPEQRTLVAQLYRELEALPIDQRVAWTLRYVEGEALDGIAEMSGCSLSTAKRRIHRADRSIRKRMGGAL
ncbi:MAG: sigma-70 family RNA polymerase sigma factor [Myxococcota bacterium]